MSFRTALAVTLGLVVLVLTGSVWAEPYNIVGSGDRAYYDVNVVYRLTPDGQPMSRITGYTISGANPQQGVPLSLIDGNLAHWGVTGMIDDTTFIQADIKLDRVYTLSAIKLDFAAYGNAEYEIRVSADGVQWDTLIGRTPVTGARVFATFSPTDVRFIEYQIWGPGELGNLATVYASEFSAYVAASATTNVPQREEGYNILKGATLIQESHWAPWASASCAVNGEVMDYATPWGSAENMSEAVWDLGYTAWLTAVQVSMYAGWDSLQISISTDNDHWTELRIPDTEAAKPLALSWGETIGLEAPAEARYIKITGYGGGANGHLTELMAFATTKPIPEPATMSLLALGGLAMLRRRK